MKITDKIDVSNNIREGAGQGGKDLLPQKSVKGVEAVTAEMLESLKLEEADFFTISDELKNVISNLIQKTGSEGPDKPANRDIKAFIGALFKDRALKGELAGVDISRAQDLPGPLEADVVSISRGMNSLLRSVIITGSGEPREICIPQGAAMSPFLTALLNELFPGWRIRLLKVCRKRRPSPDNGNESEEEAIDPPKGEAAAHGFDNSPLKGYHANRIRFRAEGRIRTADKKDFKFGLELNVTPKGEVREDVFTLDPLTIDYGGASTELDDMKFTFGSGEGSDSAFSAGAGRLIIDLREMGKDVEGSAIWGLDDSGNGIWVEE